MTRPALTLEQYALELYRTKPDFVIYRPSGEHNPDSENQQVIVAPLPSGDFLATWTMSTRENHADQHIVVARGTDKGKTWSAPQWIDGASAQEREQTPGKFQASWSFFIEAPALGRIYLLYSKNIGVTDARDDTTCILRLRYSEDEGRTWSKPFDHLKMARGAIDHPDPAIPVNFVACFQSFCNIAGTPMVSFTRWGSGSENLLEVDSEVFFLRFDNILREPDPAMLTLTTLPRAEHGLRVPHPTDTGVSVAQEAMTTILPNGRLLTAMRTLQGCNYWSLSDDDGETWTKPMPLLANDLGPRLPNPISPSPLYQYAPGKFFFLFHNNDGYQDGSAGPADYTHNRHPTWIALGEYAPGAHQPIVFGEPRILMGTARVVVGPGDRIEPCSYPSYFEHGGVHYLWYPDRKHFVLGKVLNPHLAL